MTDPCLPQRRGLLDLARAREMDLPGGLPGDAGWATPAGYADHPLHVVSYSLPFEGMVTREELLQHLHVHPRLPEAIPFVFKYYDRDWGLCASQTPARQPGG